MFKDELLQNKVSVFRIFYLIANLFLIISILHKMIYIKFLLQKKDLKSQFLELQNAKVYRFVKNCISNTYLSVLVITSYTWFEMPMKWYAQQDLKYKNNLKLKLHYFYINITFSYEYYFNSIILWIFYYFLTRLLTKCRKIIVKSSHEDVEIMLLCFINY